MLSLINLVNFKFKLVNLLSVVMFSVSHGVTQIPAGDIGPNSRTFIIFKFK